MDVNMLQYVTPYPLYLFLQLIIISKRALMFDKVNHVGRTKPLANFALK
jgi:hypothetical protein